MVSLPRTPFVDCPGIRALPIPPRVATPGAGTRWSSPSRCCAAPKLCSIRPPGSPRCPDPASSPGASSGLWAFYWHFIRQVRWLVVALFVFGGLIAMLDATIPVFIGRVVGLVSTHAPADAAARHLAAASGHGRRAAAAAAAGLLLGARRADQPDRQSGPLQPDPLAEPLARRAPELDVLPERFRRPHRQPRACRPARRCARASCMAFDAVWYILVYGSSALVLLASADWRLALPILLWFVGYAGMLRYFVPRLRERSRARVGDALDADRARRRQLHQHPDGQAVRPRRATRTSSCARRSTSTPSAFRDQTRMITAISLHAGADERGAGRRHRRASRSGCGAAGSIAVGAVATAMPLAWQIDQHRRLGGAQRHLDLREYRHGAGRHALDRGAAADARPAGRARAARSRGGEIRFEDVHFDYGRSRDAAGCCTASTSTSRRASGSGWSAPRAPASRPWSTCCCASTTPERGPHPDRRPGHRRA